MKNIKKTVLIASSFIIVFFIIFIPLFVFADKSPSTSNPFEDIEIGNVKSSSEFDIMPSAENIKKSTNQDSDNSEEESSNEIECPIPEDGFDGDYADFPNKDGTVTRVMDNGSVMTMYPDGSAEGVDYKCNRYTVGTDGVITIHATDGDKYICTQEDGIKEIVSPDGTRTVLNDDNTIMTITPAGVRFEKDEEGTIVAASFENGERIELFDENGDYIEGEYHIYGPNGESFSFVNELDYSADPDSENESRFEFWMEGNGKSYGVKTYNDGHDNVEAKLVLANGDTLDYTEKTVKNEDGTVSSSGELNMVSGSGDFEMNNKVSTREDASGENGEYTASWRVYSDGEEKTGEGSLVRKNGDICSLDYNNSDGESFGISTDGDVATYYDSDGFLMTVNKETGDLELTNGSLHVKSNINTEEIELFHDETEDGSTLDYEDGVYVLRDGKTKEEYRLTLNEDGSSEMIKPNGDVLTRTADGRMFKNGIEVESFEEITEEVFRPDADDVLGSWDISLQFSNMSSQLVDMIIDIITKAVEEAFDTSLDGEVTSGLEDQVANIPGTMEITKGTGKNDVNVTLTMYGDGGEASTYKYTGKVKNGTMKLKLVGEEASVSDESINIGLNKLEFELYGRGDKRYMTGVYVLKSFVLNADINYSGDRYYAAEE